MVPSRVGWPGMVVCRRILEGKRGDQLVFGVRFVDVACYKSVSDWTILVRKGAHLAPIAPHSAASIDTIPGGPIFGVATGTLPPAFWRLASAILTMLCI